MHHKDHNVHVHGFRFPASESFPIRRRWNAVPCLRWIAIAMLALAILGCYGVHP